MTTSAAARSPLIDLFKALATQLIVWHHLALYGPMSDVVWPLAPDVFGWLADRARLVVQVFLVIAGYLAAQSLARRLEEAPGASPLQPVRLVWRRFLRLAWPYWVALGLAVLSAALARQLMDHPAIPGVPTWGQLVAHALMLHDVLGHEGLSAGVWYVAIDFQLYVLFVAMAALSRGLARATGGRVRRWLAWLCLGLTLGSMYEFNLDASLDPWGVYFFGAYGLGVLVHEVGRSRYKAPLLLCLGVAVWGALMHAWRDRLALAGLTAIALACAAARPALPGVPAWLQTRWLPCLAQRSYALFLVHYPVCLAVNALVTWAWPDQLGVNVLGLLAAWLGSLAAAEVLHRLCETSPAPRYWMPAMSSAWGRRLSGMVKSGPTGL